MDRWPAFVLPKPDELLSSWLLRTAHAHQTKAHTFCKVVWPKLSFWNRDIDRMALPAVCETMAQKTGVSRERSYQTTLAAYEGHLFEKNQYQGNNLWIMPLGIYHRDYSRHGIQYCPGCLKADGNYPYYRRWWRLALAVACPMCGGELLDACSTCHRPIVFHRNDIGRRNELPAHSISHCAYCQTNLAFGETSLVSKALLHYQQRWYERINADVVSTDTCDYFDVLHHVVWILTSRRPRLAPFQQAVCEETSIGYHLPAGGHTNCIERLRLDRRLNYLTQAGWLMEEWPSRFVGIAKQSHTWASFILQDKGHLPKWFINQVYHELSFC